MIAKHIVISSILAGGRNWKSMYEVLGPDTSLIAALNHLVNQGSIEIYWSSYSNENLYRLREGSQYSMLVS